jgi:transposase
LRERSGKKPGGQKGRTGKTLRQVDDPDFIKICESNYCTCCGEDLSEIASVLTGKRQVMDIPKIEMKVTEYRQFKKV